VEAKRRFSGMAMAATLPTPTTADARAKPNHPDLHAAFRPHPCSPGMPHAATRGPSF
jgi:hypothetical protein